MYIKGQKKKVKDLTQTQKKIFPTYCALEAHVL